MLRAVLLDLGNVVAFFDHDRACRALAALGPAGLSAGEVRARVFASGLELEADCGRLDPPAFLARLKQTCGIDAPDEAVARAWSDIFTPNPAVESLLPRIRRALPTLVLASNTNALHFAWLGDHFAAPLAYFDHFALSFRLGVVKPDRAFFEACLEMAKADAGECLLIDDKPDYVDAARALGIHAQVYTPAVNVIETFAALGRRL